MNAIYLGLQVFFIKYLMFPKTPLPARPLTVESFLEIHALFYQANAQ